MSNHIQPVQLFASFNNDVRPALDELYSEGLQQYWDWLGESFYSFFGSDNFGLAKVDDLPSDATQKQIEYFLAANDLATKLNNLNFQIFRIERENGVSLADGDWPGSDLQKYNYAYYEQNVVPVILQILQQLSDIRENILISAPDGFNDSWGSGPFAFGTSPPENLPELIDAVLDTTPGFLQLFGVQVSTKKSIPQGTPTATVGPSTIVSDIDLELSLGLSPGGATHYIGMLEPAERSNGKRKENYLPVRLSPSAENIEKGNKNLQGWSDSKYSIISNSGKFIKPPGDNKLVNGVEIPLGLEITITDIVPSETGLWVGFVSTDAKLRDDLIPTSPNPQFDTRWDYLITRNQSRVLYTKAEYIRIKNSALVTSADPYISEKAIIGAERLDSFEDNISSAISVKGSERVDPENSQSWVKLDPEEVVLKYYDFVRYNYKIYSKNGEEEVFYNTNSFETAPTLKLSEGFYYFISGETKRPTEAELIDESQDDIENSQEGISAAKSAAALNSFAQI